MSFLDNLKGGALKLLGESAIAQQAIPVITEALQKLEGTSVEVFGNDVLFRFKLSEPSYYRLPQGVRNWVTLESWHKFLYGVKDSVFLIDGEHLKLHPNFRAAVNDFVHKLIHGQKHETAAPAESPTTTPKIEV